MPEDYPTLSFPDQSAFREWLDRNHTTERGLWLRIARQGSGHPTVSRAEALDVALCYGWIDGQSKSLDGEWYLQKYTRRGKRSTWSKRNREHVARLVASGEMRPSGLAEVDAAKQDGRWDRAYDAPATATVPDDLQAALDASPAAAAFFATLKGQNRFGILHRIQTAVKPETRARRIEKFVGMLAAGQTIHP